jgi:hypothetical protein
MKTFSIIALLALSMTAAADPVGNTFTYQGRLNHHDAPANGAFDLKFELFDMPEDGVAVAPAVELPAQTLTNGLFSAELNFGGPEVFNGTAYWIEMQARPAGAADYLPVPGRTAVRPTPYALRAMSVNDGSITGSSLVDGAITSAKIAPAAVGMAQLSPAVAPTAGQVLGFDGDALSWITPGPGGGGSGPWLMNGTKTYYSAGFVGVGTGNPLSTLHVASNWTGDDGTANIRLSGSRPTMMWVRSRSFPELTQLTDYWLAHMSGAVQGNLAFYHRNTDGSVFPFTDTGYRPVLSITPALSVGIGTEVPEGRLHVYESGSVTHVLETGGGTNSWSQIRFKNGNGQWIVGTSRDYNGDQLYFSRLGGSTIPLGIQPNGDVFAQGDVTATRLVLRADPVAPTNAAVLCADPGVTNFVPYNTALNRAMDVVANNVTANDITMHDASVRQLTIRGGADLAEPFAMSHLGVEPGTVVVIDEKNPGKLRRSTCAYDKKVAGIVSGANGIRPGISMIQEDTLEAGENVALSGRVFVKADAGAGAIEPGDLLTTSSTPGRAMKAADHDKAQGAILGKAMTSLNEGMVLVLVTLQ